MYLPSGTFKESLLGKSCSCVLEPFTDGLSRKQLILLEKGSAKKFFKTILTRLILNLVIIFIIISCAVYYVSVNSTVGKAEHCVRLFFTVLYITIPSWFLLWAIFLRDKKTRCYYGQDFYDRNKAIKKARIIRILSIVAFIILFIFTIIITNANTIILNIILAGLTGVSLAMIFAAGIFKIGERGGCYSFCRSCGRVNTIFFGGETRSYGIKNAEIGVDKVIKQELTIGSIYDSNKTKIGNVTATTENYTYKRGTSYDYTKTYKCACCGKIYENKGTDIKWNSTI